MDKDAYIAELEAELDAAKAKYNTIYESVRSVDRIINNFKRRHKRLYDFLRDSYKKQQLRKTPNLTGSVTHPAGKDTPLAKIYTNAGNKRLNLVLAKLEEADYRNTSTIKALTEATKLAVKKHYALRIITRNNQPNPKLYCDFLKARNIPIPENYSFYTDIDSRLAPSVHRLDVSPNDIFYSNLEGDKDA